MTKMIWTFSGQLTGIGELTVLEIPKDSEEVSFHIEGAQPSVVIRVVSANDPTDVKYTRHFTMVLAGEPLPANYKKYISTFNFGNPPQEIHVIELEV